MSATPSLTNLQQELLKLYSFNVNESDLVNIKRMIAKYFAAKAISEADEIWEKRGYTNDAVDSWLNDERQ